MIANSSSFLQIFYFEVGHFVKRCTLFFKKTKELSIYELMHGNVNRLFLEKHPYVLSWKHNTTLTVLFWFIKGSEWFACWTISGEPLSPIYLFVWLIHFSHSVEGFLSVWKFVLPWRQQRMSFFPLLQLKMDLYCLQYEYKVTLKLSRELCYF